MKQAKEYMHYIKKDSVVRMGEGPNKSISMSDWIAAEIREKLQQLPFKQFFNRNVFLVPIPRSSLQVRNALWVPDRLAQAMERKGLGRRIQILERNSNLRRSSISSPENRPLPKEHFDSLKVIRRLDDLSEIVLIDDIITRGHTMLGAAWKILDVFPNAKVCGFAAMRTISNSLEFKDFYDPVKGEIEYRTGPGDALRRP
ncbi:MAG: phosphoribosyltransferase [Thermoprotei archaeon]